MLGVTLLPATAPAVGTLLALLAATALLLYLYATRHFGYWRRKGVPFLKPLPFVGNILDVVLFRKHFGEALYEIHRNMKGQRYLGLFILDQPVLFLKDLNIVKSILQKDFGSFTNRGFNATTSDPMNLHALFSRKGKDWRDLRVKLSPAFTSGKLKRFYALIEQNARYLDTYFDDAVKNGTAVNVADACGRFTTDAVASVGFGIEGSSLVGEETYFRKVLKNTFNYRKLGVLKAIGLVANTPLARYRGCKLVPDDLTAFLRHSIWETVRHRVESGTAGVRGDFLDLLIELREKGSISEDGDAASNGNKSEKNDKPLSLEGDAFISQAFTFLTAGFETSSTTMSFALHRLALDQEIQEELRSRLQQAMDENDGKLTYEVLQSVSYLDMVLMETLRLHPVLPFLDRTCTQAYQLPGSDVVVEKGTVILMSSLGVHMDPDFYPDPLRFDPERFSEAGKKSRPSAAFLAFGDGPRLCIGMRLGLLQAKLGLAHILLHYRVRPTPATRPAAAYDLESILFHPAGGVPLLLDRV